MSPREAHSLLILSIMIGLSFWCLASWAIAKALAG